MTYDEAVQRLYSLGGELKSAKFDLERMRTLAAAFDNPQKAYRVVHVAGTNGKGSTCAMLEAALRSAGFRTGLYTSPHLVEPTERIKIGPAEVDRDNFAELLSKVFERSEEVLGVIPSYFETLTAMAFLAFRDAGVEFAVIETGLGGRLDATNIVDPELCVITPIDYDHQFYLGDSLTEIAGEKAGILKPRLPAVFAHQHEEALRVLEQRARELDAPVMHSSAVANLPRVPFTGAHQIENARTAVAALQVLGVDARGIEGAQWPGRLQLVHHSPAIYLDGAHNPAGAEALARFMRECCAGRPMWLVYGTMADKEFAKVAQILFPLAEKILLPAVDNSRALSPEELLPLAEGRAELVGTVAEAYDKATQAPAETAVFLTGSLYAVGEALAHLRRMK